MTANRFQADGPADHVTGQPTSMARLGCPPGMAASRGRGPAGRRLAAYSTTGQPWWLVPALILLPDLAWAGYLGGPASGPSATTRRTTAPAGRADRPGLVAARPLVLALGLVWLAHIGLDQLLGYGLKYDDSFQHTHLGILGKKRKEAS